MRGRGAPAWLVLLVSLTVVVFLTEGISNTAGAALLVPMSPEQVQDLLPGFGNAAI